MLQILLLTEKEVSAIVRMNQQIAEHLGLLRTSEEQEIKELRRSTSADAVAATIQEKLANEEWSNSCANAFTPRGPQSPDHCIIGKFSKISYITNNYS